MTSGCLGLCWQLECAQTIQIIFLAINFNFQLISTINATLPNHFRARQSVNGLIQLFIHEEKKNLRRPRAI